jgi:prepilin-type N-terminal cleavage/methylation domain-containing protein
MSRSFSKSSQAGFTLVEMMVVIAIFIITTGIVLANLPAAREKNALELLAQEIAVTIRQAQVYGAATFGFDAGSAREFPSYGVLLPKNGSNYLDHFFIFADSDNNNLMDGSNCETSNECVEQFNLRGGVVISELSYCVTQGCSGSSGGAIEEPLIVLFERPGTDATFLTSSNPPVMSHLKIILKNLQNNQERAVVIWNTGHIYVEPV